jgi:hypothetical protein
MINPGFTLVVARKNIFAPSALAPMRHNDRSPLILTEC